ncbi:MAG TPA: hypothetical protein VMY37_27840 [Thermoguttaceae bacterium]|nr:hypothetical protein [Thermoguttaceae bacterium]
MIDCQLQPKPTPPVWGRITDYHPKARAAGYHWPDDHTPEGTDNPPTEDFDNQYQWEQVFRDDNHHWTAVSDLHNKYEADGDLYTWATAGEGSRWDDDDDFLYSPAVEINGQSVVIGSIVRLIPSRVIVEGENSYTHRKWMFSREELRPFRLTQSIVNTGVVFNEKTKLDNDSLQSKYSTADRQTTVEGEWLDWVQDIDNAVTLYAPHATGFKTWDRFLNHGIAYGGAFLEDVDNVATGWARYEPHGTALDYDDKGGFIWRGEWQIVSLEARTIVGVTAKADIAPGAVGDVYINYDDPGHVPHASTEIIECHNDTAGTIAEGEEFQVHWLHNFYIWRPLNRYQSYAKFAKVQAGWVANATGIASRVVPLKRCHADGTGETGAAFNAATMIKPSHDTNLVAGDVVEYENIEEPVGACTRVIVSDIWDRPIGTVLWESVNTANIRRGWRLCDGAAGAPDLSAKFIMCVDVGGAADEDAITDTGGFKHHGKGNRPAVAADNDHDNHLTVQETPFDAVAGATDVVNLDNTDFTPCEVVDYDENYVHTETDNRPPYYVMAAIQRFE